MKTGWYKLLMALLLCIAALHTHAQDSTVQTRPKKFNLLRPDTAEGHSPKRAMIYSAIIPGLGQAYNKKYWKVPIVYAGFATFAYLINDFSIQYKRFQRAYNYQLDGDSNTISEFPYYSADGLAKIRDDYRRYRDLNIILCVGWYALQIIDANVDAHLFEFKMLDKQMTLNWEPTLNRSFRAGQQNMIGGLRVRIGF